MPRTVPLTRLKCVGGPNAATVIKNLLRRFAAGSDCKPAVRFRFDCLNEDVGRREVVAMIVQRWNTEPHDRDCLVLRGTVDGRKAVMTYNPHTRTGRFSPA